MGWGVAPLGLITGCEYTSAVAGHRCPGQGGARGYRGLATGPLARTIRAGIQRKRHRRRVLRSLTGEDLREIGVTSVGHRRRLLDAIKALPHDTATAMLGARDIPTGAERRQ